MLAPSKVICPVELLKVPLLQFQLPATVWLPVPELKVPPVLTVKSPFISIFKLDISNVPSLTSKSFVTLRSFANKVTVLEASLVKLLKYTGVPLEIKLIFWFDPSNTVLCVP